jgi:hypothetical protein
MTHWQYLAEYSTEQDECSLALMIYDLLATSKEMKENMDIL